MSATLQQPPVAPLPPAPRGSLFRAELHRFRARRFIQVLFGIAVVGWLVALVIGLLNYGTPTDADFAEAQAQVDQILEDNNRFREDCLADPEAATGGQVPDGVTPEEYCGPPLTAEDIGGAGAFLTKAPFDLAELGTTGAMGASLLVGALAFVIGTTWIGAEWSSRSMVALLFWAPRRWRVMGTKFAVLVLGATLLGVLAQVGWLVMAAILDAAVGLDEPLPEGFWSTLLQTQARGVLLVVLFALLGSGLTSIVRNTGAALGIAFGYVVVVQIILAATKPSWAPWMLGTNAAALVNPGGLTLPLFDQIDPTSGDYAEYYLGNLQGGLFVGITAAVLIGVGSLLFARRDIS